MSDGVNVDWSLLKQPDSVGDYANAFQAGRELAQAQPQRPNAMAPSGGDTGAASWAARIDALEGPGRAQAATQAELLANLGTGLRTFPYAQRAGILAHLAPALAARGVPSDALGQFDPTDEALGEVIGAARSLGARLSGAGTDGAGTDGVGAVGARSGMFQNSLSRPAGV